MRSAPMMDPLSNPNEAMAPKVNREQEGENWHRVPVPPAPSVT